jgi:glycolate oxidase iron-sulfur subunit
MPNSDPKTPNGDPTQPQDPGVRTSERVTLRELTLLLREMDDLMERCMRCGFCQSVCPVYGATFREADVARGKIALLQDLSRELTKDAGSVNDRLLRCLLCTSCECACPSGVRIMDILIKGRSLIAGYQGLGVVKKLIFRLILPRPRLFNGFILLSSIFQHPFLKREHPENEALRTNSLPLFRSILGNRHIPSLPLESFTLSHGTIDEEPGPCEENEEDKVVPASKTIGEKAPEGKNQKPFKKPLKVAYFPGCVPDKLYPKVSEATVKVLRRHGVGVFMSEDFVCCGIPLLSSGDRIGFLRLMTKNLRILLSRDFDCLITSCATCASTIKETWPRFVLDFKGEERELLERLKNDVHDINVFLTSILELDFPENKDFGEEDKILTYHDPCHLRRSMGVWEEPRKILKSLPGYRYLEMPEAERCCGNGGSFNLQHYDISTDIGKRKRDNIVSVKPKVLATSCPACMLQISDMLSQENDKVEVRHVIELYAEYLENRDSFLKSSEGEDVKDAGSLNGQEAEAREAL